jgi:hypothetical protein
MSDIEINAGTGATTPDDDEPVVAPPAPLPDGDARIPEDVSAAVDGSLAAKMRAQAKRIRGRRTERFPIPDTDLVVEAKVIKDARSVRTGLKSEMFIIRATSRLLLVDEDGVEDEVPGLLGVKVEKAADLVKFVFGRNPWALDRFVADMLLWMQGRTAQLEEDLGE